MHTCCVMHTHEQAPLQPLHTNSNTPSYIHPLSHRAPSQHFLRTHFSFTPALSHTHTHTPTHTYTDTHTHTHTVLLLVSSIGSPSSSRLPFLLAEGRLRFVGESGLMGMELAGSLIWIFEC